MQGTVDLKGGMSGNGAGLWGDVKAEVEKLLQEAGWVYYTVTREARLSVGRGKADPVE